MFRHCSMIILAVLFFGVSSLDAQLFRRFAQPSNYGQAYQQQSQQAAQTSDCTCNQQSQQQQTFAQQRQMAAQQSNYYRAPSTSNRRSNDAQAYDAPLADADQPSLERQNAVQASDESTRQQQQQTQQPRYALYYNPRTNQTVLRPIRSALAGTFNQSGQRGVFRQPQTPAVQPQVVGTPVATRSQVDIARQRGGTTSQVQPSVNNLSLNAPQPTVAAPVVAPKSTPIEPAIATPTGTLTSAPAPQTSPGATQPESNAPQKAFSILESSNDSSSELGGPVEDK